MPEAEVQERLHTDQINSLLAESRRLWFREPEKGLRLVDKSLGHIDSSNSTASTIEAFLSRGVCELQLYRPDSGVRSLRRGLKLCGNPDAPQGLEIMFWLGDAYVRQNRCREAAATLRFVMRRGEELELPDLACSARLTLAKLHILCGESVAARPLIRQARKKAERLGDDFLMGRVLDVEGLLFEEYGETEKSIHAYLDSRSLFKRLGLRVCETGVAANYSAVLRREGRFDEASDQLLFAGRSAGRLGHHVFEGYVLVQQSMLCEKQGQLNDAINFCREGVEVLQRNEGPTQLGFGLSVLGSMLLDTGDYHGCLEQAGTALELSRRIDDPQVGISSHLQLACAYEQIGDLSASLHHYKEYMTLKNRRLADLRNLYITDAESLERIECRGEESSTTEHRKKTPFRSHRTLRSSNGFASGRAEGAEAVDTETAHLTHRTVQSVDMPGYLARRFPMLTPTEIRVCLLLRDGLDSQEVADHLHRSIHTIETHRRRIRRKLGLSRSENLISCLVAEL